MPGLACSWIWESKRGFDLARILVDEVDVPEEESLCMMAFWGDFCDALHPLEEVLALLGCYAWVPPPFCCSPYDAKVKKPANLQGCGMFFLFLGILGHCGCFVEVFTAVDEEAQWARGALILYLHLGAWSPCPPPRCSFIFYSISFCFTLLFSIALFSILCLYFLFYSMLLYSIIFYAIILHFIPLFSIIFYCI